MRLFCAVELPLNVYRTLATQIPQLQRRLPRARWARVEGLHITLKFLGEQPAAIVPRLAEEAQAALATCKPVEVTLGGGGFFPDPRRARVAWVGGRAPGLETWAAALEEAAANCGVPREARPFSLHLTLARLDRPWPESATQLFLAQVETWQFEPFTVQEVVLFESQLGSGGARYTPRARWPVGGGHDT